MICEVCLLSYCAVSSGMPKIFWHLVNSRYIQCMALEHNESGIVIRVIYKTCITVGKATKTQ